jgi:hypothetical protein
LFPGVTPAVDQPEAELKIHVTGPSGWKRTDPFFLYLAALGPPPMSDVRLADAAGLNKASEMIRAA